MYKLARKFKGENLSDYFQKWDSKGGNFSIAKIAPKFFPQDEVIQILEITERTLFNWRENGKFKEDMTDHEGVFWYSAERVYQMKSSRTKAAQIDSARQHLENLPDELLNQPRFFRVGRDVNKKGTKIFDQKAPVDKWNNPDNQKRYDELQFTDKRQMAGFDIVGHGKAADYLILDFDHVLDDAGNFCSSDAEKWYNLILSFADTFVEKSVSGRGLHMIYSPSDGEFPTIVNTSESNGVLDFGDGAKIEVFYKPEGRYFLLTGDVYDCAPKTPIATDCAAVTALIQEIAGRNAKKDFSDETAPNDDAKNATDIANARDMLSYINCVTCTYTEWLHVGMILKTTGNPIEDWLKWSSTDAERYDEKVCRDKWKTFKENGALTIATLYLMASKNGYKLPKFKAEYNDRAVATARYVSTQQIFNDCPIDLTIPYGFKITSAGLFAVKKDRDILISSTPPLITRKLRDAQEINYSYELTYRDGKGKWITCPTFYTGRFLIDNWQILALADKGLSIEPKDVALLTTYFNDLLHCDGNFSKIPTSLTYRQTGWVNDFSVFVYPTDNDSRKVIRPGIPYDDLFVRRGNKDIWLKALNTAQEQGGAIVRVVIGTALAAPLCRPLNLPNSQVHTDGQRGLGKTPLLKLAMSIFGNPRGGRLLRTFAATNKHFLEYAMAFNDLPLAVDERETLDARDADKRIEKMIYDFYEGVGNQAQRRDGTSRPVELFGGSRISNGEHPLLKDYDKAGAFKRVLPLHVDNLFNLDFSRELHTLAENNFGLFGEQWIDYIKKNLRTISDEYHAILKLIETKGVKIGTIHQKFDVEPTHLQTLTLALVAFRHFEKMLEIFRDADNLQLNDDFNRIMSTLPTQSQLDDSTRALDFLKSFVAGNYRKFFGCKEVNEEFIGTDAFGQIYDDTGEVAFLPHKLRTILEDDGKFPSAESIVNEFAQKGYLKTSKGLGHQYKTRNFSKSQKPVNVYMFLPNILWESAEDTKNAIISDTADELADFPGTIIPHRKMPF